MSVLTKKSKHKASGDHYVPSRFKKRTRERGWIRISDLPRSPKADAVFDDILDRLQRHFIEDTLPRGGRGLFYDLRPHGMAGNPRGIHYIKKTKKEVKAEGWGPMEAGPKYVQDLLCSMRRVFNPKTKKWLIDEDWIADRRMPSPIRAFETSDAQAGAQRIAGHIEALQLLRQEGQPVYLEIRCEAEDLMPRLARVAEPYGVPVYSGSGSDGLKPKKDAALRAAWRDVPTIIGLLTDYDRHGGDIADAFIEDADAFFQWHQEYENAPGSLTIPRLALTFGQAIEHELLDDDGKAEVDGLPVQVLDALVRDWIEANSVRRIRERVIKAEPKMRTEVFAHLQRILKEPP